MDPAFNARSLWRNISFSVPNGQPSGRRLTVPNHRELAKGTLRALIREAGISKEQFSELL